jgi:hypothetical protein
VFRDGGGGQTQHLNQLANTKLAVAEHHQGPDPVFVRKGFSYVDKIEHSYTSYTSPFNELYFIWKYGAIAKMFTFQKKIAPAFCERNLCQ